MLPLLGETGRLRLVLGRVAVLVASLLAASAIVFWLVNALPGDVAQVMLGNSSDPASVAELRARLGLDRPLLVRYGDWLAGLATGDLGHSAFTGEPVGGLVARPLTVTFWLVALGTLGSLVVAVPAGLWAAHRRRHWDGFAVNALSQVGMAVPAFLAGIALVLLFAVNLRWLPANGYVSFGSDPAGWLRTMLLPVVSISVIQGAALTRYVRSAFVEVGTSDHIRTARSIGWGRLSALWRHGRREASLQVVTVLGLQVAAGFAGAIVVEQVFVLPGLGSMLMNAVASRDLMVVQSVVMVLVAIVLVVMALLDLSYVALDPRLRTRCDGRGGQ
ncbi:ABC transporter permease [Aestuariimicrobium sp. T2.26MG-19.2B]|uniref:ABC transporter permease n=1 Tax=Aestuariimicrobium sp. T2.26MG-19.2B TaxID=3040679 RepID=UPI0024779D44|nr:ABC transporter permease [Aestuariimicrobium sp. T2.26MG-19.2B]CAI9410592.1 Glutathione transport system permease protein GsiC [Aestuariimicrobium sp. T2.26MG-19.2B]